MSNRARYSSASLDQLEALRRARDRMDRDFASPLRLADLAECAHMSSGHFSRSFVRVYGVTPHHYLTTRRLERARTLLQLGSLSVTEVCIAVGFSSLGTFSRRFHEMVGVSPSHYAQSHSHPPLPGCVARLVLRPVRNGEARRASHSVR